jgi:hypothetical protein
MQIDIKCADLILFSWKSLNWLYIFKIWLQLPMIKFNATLHFREFQSSFN